MAIQAYKIVLVTFLAVPLVLAASFVVLVLSVAVTRTAVILALPFAAISLVAFVAA